MEKLVLFNAIIATLSFLGGGAAYGAFPWENNAIKAIPPTPAIMNVTTSNSTIHSDVWNEVLNLVGLRGINVFGSNDSKTVYFNVTIMDENGTNTGSGATVFKNETNHIWYFRTLHNGTNIQITSNSTGITISAPTAGSVTGAANVGSGEGQVFRDNVGGTLNFKSFKQGSGITITNNADDITIDSTSSGFSKINNFPGGDAKILATNQSGTANIKPLISGTGISITNGTSSITISATGSGGFTKIQNVPGGTAHILKSNSSNQADVKSLTASSGISIQNGTDTITISSTVTGESTTATNLGTSGTGIFAQLSSYELQFKKLITSTLSITSNSTNVIIDTLNSGFTNISNIGTGDASLVSTNQSGTANIKRLTAGTGISIQNGTSTVTISSTVSGGFTKVNNFGTGSLSLVGTNSSNIANVKTLASGTGITLTNGTSTGTIATNFKIDTLSTIAVDKFISAFDNVTGDWTTKTFSVNSKTCSAGQHLFSIDNSTGDVTCTTDSGGSGFSTIENTAVGTGLVVKTNSSNKAEIKGISSGQGITVTNDVSDIDIATNFKVDSLSTIATDKFISAFDNSSGDWSTKTFSVNTRSTQADFFVNGIDNSTGDVAIKQFSINSITCDSGKFFSASDNATGHLTCTTPAGGSGFTTIETTAVGNSLVKTNSSNKAEIKGITAGSGIKITNGVSDITITEVGGPSSFIMNMSKRYGAFTPNSATALGEGILGTTATLDGTETFEYNTTRNVLSIRSATGTVAGNNAGISQVTANFNLFRLDQNPKAWVEAAPSANRIGLNRVFIGFQSGATVLPQNADTIVNAISAFGVCIRTTDTLYQRCENDGAGTGTYTSLGITEDTNWHTFYIYADYDNRQWCIQVDGGTASCTTTDIPAATTRLYFNAQAETSTATAGQNFNYGMVRVQNDK